MTECVHELGCCLCACCARAGTRACPSAESIGTPCVPASSRPGLTRHPVAPDASSDSAAGSSPLLSPRPAPGSRKKCYRVVPPRRRPTRPHAYTRSRPAAESNFRSSSTWVITLQTHRAQIYRRPLAHSRTPWPGGNAADKCCAVRAGEALMRGCDGSRGGGGGREGSPFDRECMPASKICSSEPGSRSYG